MPRQVSYAALDPVWRAQAWIAYVPTVLGVQPKVPSGPYGLPTDHDREARRISVTGSADAAGLRVLVGERLVDMEAELVVELNGTEVFRGVPQRSLAALVATSLRGDPDLAYEAWIPLVP